MSLDRPTLLIAGGGTGGHVFPGLAVADAVQRLSDAEVIFVGTARGLEVKAVPARGYALELLDVEPMKGGGPVRFARGAAVAGAATFKSLSLLRRRKPRAVLSVGGYASGPVSLAAAALGVPVAILEPNRVMGLANRLLAPLAKRAYLTTLGPDEALPSVVRSSSVRMLGIPMREGFRPMPYVASDRRHVLVLGGSQGAAALNERLPEAIGRLRASVPGVTVLHQAGRDRDAGVRAAYAREKVEGVEVVPFVEDVAAAIARADVVVARAGASTLAEICAIGRAAVLVPFPFAADDHQAKNAASLAEGGGAIAIRQEAADGYRLANELGLLFADAVVRTTMADRARAFGRPRAAYDVAADLLHLARVDFEALSGTSRTVNGVNGVHPHGGDAHFARAPEME